MRTIRNSSHLAGGGVPAQGVYLPGGVPARDVPAGEYLPLVYLPQGVYPPMGVHLLGECTCPGGGVGRYPPPLGAGTPPPLWTEWLTDRCKNITFATLLRTIIMCHN